MPRVGFPLPHFPMRDALGLRSAPPSSPGLPPQVSVPPPPVMPLPVVPLPVVPLPKAAPKARALAAAPKARALAAAPKAKAKARAKAQSRPRVPYPIKNFMEQTPIAFIRVPHVKRSKVKKLLRQIRGEYQRLGVFVQRSFSFYRFCKSRMKALGWVIRGHPNQWVERVPHERRISWRWALPPMADSGSGSD